MKKAQILKLLPNMKIAILHSQVPTKESEAIMEDFCENKYDILLSTSIIESGIHLPNVNTIIVESSDRFGIADLHQLRGRVGRGEKEGYCYFLVEDVENITKESAKRLSALEKNSYLGSGYALAYQDLEIRGGGNILGENQSGHIKNIGYALYLKMFEEAINQLSTNKNTEDVMSVDMNIAVNAFVSPNLVCEDRLRLELYRRLSLADTSEKLYELEAEIVDRFGKLDSYTTNYLNIMHIKLKAMKQNIKAIKSFGQHITITKNDDSKISLQSSSKDDDDVLATLLYYFKDVQS